jgi:hypothetical protein
MTWRRVRQRQLARTAPLMHDTAYLLLHASEVVVSPHIAQEGACGVHLE